MLLSLSYLATISGRHPCAGSSESPTLLRRLLFCSLISFAPILTVFEEISQ
jgi:hypothetical protein